MTRTTPPSACIAITITSAPKPVTFAVASPRASAPPPHSCTETQRYKGCRGHKFAQAESTTAPPFFGGTCSAAIPTRDLHVTRGKCHVTCGLWTSGGDLLRGRERGGEWGISSQPAITDGIRSPFSAALVVPFSVASISCVSALSFSVGGFPCDLA